jgi:hypothetical protein
MHVPYRCGTRTVSIEGQATEALVLFAAVQLRWKRPGRDCKPDDKHVARLLGSRRPVAARPRDFPLAEASDPADLRSSCILHASSGELHASDRRPPSVAGSYQQPLDDRPAERSLRVTMPITTMSRPRLAACDFSCTMHLDCRANCDHHRSRASSCPPLNC